ncbi:helix-turn-helix domain-containing protein [Niveibacterium sp.]|uniref:helix-turn-helix domain-containing protein n=1 Tax=Niveibacterium sp. TaxID=2017444 RepID=UPI0035B0CDEF
MPRVTRLSQAVLRFDDLPDTALLSISDACTLLCRSRASIYRALKQGKLHSVKIGGSRRLSARVIREAAGDLRSLEQ